MNNKHEKVEAALKEALTKIMHDELDFESDVFVTVVGVTLSNTLEHAMVRISIFPEQDTKKVFEIITSNIYTIQKVLNSEVHMRKVPKIAFKIDTSEQHAERIERLLESVVTSE